MKNLKAFILLMSLLVTGNIYAQKDYTVHFKTGDYLPIANLQSGSVDLRSDIDDNEVIAGRYYRFIQFEDGVRKADISALEDAGVRLLEYIPQHTYLASLSLNAEQSDLVRLKARAIWKSSAAQRSASDVSQQSLPDWAIEDGRALLMIKYYQDIDLATVLQSLQEDKIDVTLYNEFNNFIEVSVPLDRSTEVAELEYISNVYPKPHPGEKEDRRGRNLHRVNRLNAGSSGTRNFNGSGINTLVRDDGALFDHLDFDARIDQTFVGPNRGDHGDGVAGIMTGAGNLDPLNRGMAHGSFMYVTDYEASHLDETMSLFNNNDVIVTNSSYSNGCNRGYSETTQIVDQQTYQNPTLMHVFSAGNSGRGILNADEQIVECGYGAGLFWGNITGGHKIGKNVIATANVNYRGEIMASSSRGPSADGRLKPDIAANGNNHVSTAEENGYRPFGGTSGAAPVVAGTMAVLHEAYQTIHSERAEAPLLKAIMLNTANDAGNIGPDYIYGWGLLNADRAISTIEDGRFLKASIIQDEIKTHTIDVPDNVAEVRIMTYWPDREASAFSSFTLLNDLNTSVNDPNGDGHLPWILDNTPDPDLLNLPATKGEDLVNNMEQVSIVNPQAGTYTLEVNGYQLPFDDGEYYVVWEFRMNEIDIIFPNGGENVTEGSPEVIHWDATGNEGIFNLYYIDSEGEESFIDSVAGDLRIYEWRAPQTMEEGARIKITRGDLEDVSTEGFLVADRPRFLDVEDRDSLPKLVWSGVEEAVSYDIHALVGAYMEVVTTVEADTFLLTDDPAYNNNWVAVSANFENGSKGMRSVATSTANNPVAFITNDQEDKPCAGEPVIFASPNDAPNSTYYWKFGQNSDPEDATTRGPHSVVYSRKGNSLAALTLTNDAGFDQAFFIMNVNDDPEEGDTEYEALSGREYKFSTEIKGADDYIWDFGDGTTDEGKNVTHIYEASGNYEVVLTAENKCGVITETFNLSIDITSVEDVVTSDFAISGNPNNGTFSVTIPDLEGAPLSVSLIANDGSIVDQRQVKQAQKNQVLNWKNISQGIYILNFNFEGRQMSQKVIVQ